jgi:hypothetical protein
MIRKIVLCLSIGIFLGGLNGAPVSAAEEKPRDARDEAPPALIGPWKLDLEASSWPPERPAFRSEVRTFQYTAEGRVLVTFMRVQADGSYITGHWAAYSDGTPTVEYRGEWGSVVWAVVSLKKLNDTALNVTATRYGKVTVESQYVLSPDGKTLTYTLGKNKMVYRRWDTMN